MLPGANTGAGSGLRRALETGIEVHFNDNESTKEFVVTIPRKEHHVDVLSTDKKHQAEGEKAPSNQEAVGYFEFLFNSSNRKRNNGHCSRASRILKRNG